MKRSKKIYLLLGVLAVVCIATLCVLRFEERTEQIKNSGEIILELPGDSVQALSWEYQSRTLGFHRQGDAWLFDEDEAFPVNGEKIDGLLEQFQAFGAAFVIEAVSDYGQYGLDDPVCTIRLQTESKTYEILLGDYSKMDSQRYVSLGDGNVYLVKNDPLDQFDADLSDMIDHDEIPAFTRAQAIRFTGAESYEILYREGGSDTHRAADVYFAQQGGGSLPLDTSRVEAYLSAITSLGLTDYVTYNATPQELETYGLASPELTVTVEYPAESDGGEGTGGTLVLHLSRDPKELEQAQKAAEKEQADPEKEGETGEETVTAYARVGESQIIYRISAQDYKALMAASCDSLRHTEVLPADFADLRQLDFSLEGAVYTFTSEKKGGERTYYYQQEELETASLQAALEGLEATGFTGEQPAGRQEIGFTAYLDDAASTAIRVGLYRYDGTDCLAVVDGEPVSLVPRACVVDLIEAVHAIVLNKAA